MSGAAFSPRRFVPRQHLVPSAGICGPHPLTHIGSSVRLELIRACGAVSSLLPA